MERIGSAEQMMQRLLILVLVTLTITSPVVGQEIEFQNLFNAESETGISCYRIPSIVTAPNGVVLVTIDERVPSCRDLKWSRDINIVMRTSPDNGLTWSEIIRLVDFPDGQSASDPSMIVDEQTGAIFMFYNFMDHDKETDVYYLHYIKSEDSGKTWSDPVDITSQIAKDSWHNDFKFITSGRGIQTKSGTLLHTMVNLDNGLHLFASDDHGESWYLIDTPIQPANESKVIELTDGSWMINSRVNGGGIRYIHTSTDKGLSWTSRPDSTLADPGCNASIIRYNESTLLFSNANSSSSRENMTIRVSTDEGMTWSAGRTIYAGGSAYSTMTVLENGDIGLLFEKDGYKENVFVRVDFKWLTR